MIWIIFYKNIEEYNPNKKRKMLIVFYDMVADKLSNKKLNPIVIYLNIENSKQMRTSTNRV